MHAVARGVPLPLGDIHNQRSLVALDNLVDFILTCIEHPAAANETFLVSDGEDLSKTDLIRRLARAIGRPARLIPVPPSLLLAGACCYAGARLYLVTVPGSRRRLAPLVLAAATLGFLVWNWPPARIFMGHARSGFLGLMLRRVFATGRLAGAHALVEFAHSPWCVRRGHDRDAVSSSGARRQVLRGASEPCLPARCSATGRAPAANPRRRGDQSLLAPPHRIDGCGGVVGRRLGVFIAYTPIVAASLWLKAGKPSLA